MYESIFPFGIDHYVLGGLLVGLGVAVPYILTGVVAGVSTFYTSTWSYLCRANFFQTDWFLVSRGWRWWLIVGLVSGGVVYALVIDPVLPTTVEWWRLLVGGVLVGIGAKMSGGCTSGHGICGMASLEKVSLVATLVFLFVAIVVAHLVTLLGL